MEDWPADSEEPKQFSQDRLNGCDLCVLLVAFRRGHVPDGETRSITQLEYDAAVKQRIEILPFLLDENAPWPRKFDELEKDPEVKSWREYLAKHHGRELFTLDPRSIDMTGALGRWLGKKKAAYQDQRDIDRIEWTDNESPYPGLFSFDQHYAPLFFGRDREVDAVLAKMSEPQGRFLVISGASGSGKSSLVAAGVWRALLQEGRLAGSEHWAWVRIAPADEESPFGSLAQGLKHQAFPRLTRELSEGQTTIDDVLASSLSPGQELVVFLDQLEELFTRSFKNEDVAKFLTHLVETTRKTSSRLRVFATVRSEFIARLEESEPVLQALNAGYHYHLGPVSPRVLQDMIEKPAKATGYEFETGLVENILHDAAQEPGNLPLVAYALHQLFKRRQERMFTHQAYKEINGVAGAIGTQADQMIVRIAPEARDKFDRVFAELVRVERDRPPTRKRATLATFKEDNGAQTLIHVLAGLECRILVTGGTRGEETVEVGHEKLFTAWPRLKAWIYANAEALRLLEHATEAAERWHNGGRNPEEVWPTRRVQEVKAALKRFGKLPSQVLDPFLDAQRVQEDLSEGLPEYD